MRKTISSRFDGPESGDAGLLRVCRRRGTSGKGTHMKVSGVVSKVQADQATVKTPWGQMVISSSAGPQNLKVGEEVEMQVN